MITEKDLNEAIAECQGKRNPNANTCIMLAAFLTIRQHLFGDDEPQAEKGYSFSAPPAPNSVVGYESDTEFGQAVYGKNAYDMWALMDETMTTLEVLNPPLYRSIMRRI